jgi:hypothetical protein
MEQWLRERLTTYDKPKIVPKNPNIRPLRLRHETGY